MHPCLFRHLEVIDISLFSLASVNCALYCLRALQHWPSNDLTFPRSNNFEKNTWEHWTNSCWSGSLTCAGHLFLLSTSFPHPTATTHLLCPSRDCGSIYWSKKNCEMYLLDTCSENKSWWIIWTERLADLLYSFNSRWTAHLAQWLKLWTLTSVALAWFPVSAAGMVCGH